VDLSTAILTRIQQKINILDNEIQQRVRVFQANTLEFNPPQKYELVMIAYNSLRELDTKEKVFKCFQNINSVLVKGGIFLIYRSTY
jgi:hypothetical protein